ncbi:predicted protein [Nematostella vectensis]|uniref:palmitoyl-protein hydrolase n=1 Tax=Nematostella vectensis TaxID=45351 RepID=A7S126_NEMVE|nr:lysophospholipase-like protein 1 [Nematostella vectensis]EDO42520.1 predicted protein [Nematostella vectensis]|eukprot:XP_001634583.1 predicted protein [Nematostella vectensis]
MALPKLKTVVNRERFKRNAAVLFFHGEEGSASNLKERLKEMLLRNFDFDHIRVVFPQAPEIISKVDRDERRPVWFNRKDYSPAFPEQIDSIERSCSLVRQLINDLVTSGIRKDRIVLGGCDMGAQIAMHVAYRYLPDVAGVFGLSTHLGPLSHVYKVLLHKRVTQSDFEWPPLLLCHGHDDKRVNLKWAAHTAEYFMDLNVETELQVYYGQNHELSVHQVNHLKEWIIKTLPDKNTIIGPDLRC